jgi:hypothetical protein
VLPGRGPVAALPAAADLASVRKRLDVRLTLARPGGSGPATLPTAPARQGHPEPARREADSSCT